MKQQNNNDSERDKWDMTAINKIIHAGKSMSTDKIIQLYDEFFAKNEAIILQAFSQTLCELDSKSLLDIAIAYIYWETDIREIIDYGLESDIKEKIMKDYKKRIEKDIENEVTSDKKVAEAGKGKSNQKS